MATFKVIFFDEDQGGVDAVEVSASSHMQAIEKVELMGEYEVIDVERVNTLDDTLQVIMFD